METNNKKQSNLQINYRNGYSISYLVKAKAQFGEEELTPKKFLVKDELHLATIPLVGRLENNSFLIH